MMGPLDVKLVTIRPTDEIADIHVGDYFRVMATNRTTGDFIIEGAVAVKRRLGIFDFILGREPRHIILVKP